MPAILPSSRATRCRGPQPVRAQAEPEASAAAKKAWETKGLWPSLESGQESPAAADEPSVSRFSRLFGSGFGLAQASHSAAGISLAEGTASRVISDDAIDEFRPVPHCDQPSRW